jgi:hypothetical protein
MKELKRNELMELNGGSPGDMNYIGGLSPAIPESGGAFVAGFFRGFIKAIFNI